jgi:hypothetical protein
MHMANICFPDAEQPFFRTPQERDVAAQLQCPLHGVRFDIRRTMHIYVAKWRWKNEESPLFGRRVGLFVNGLLYASNTQSHAWLFMAPILSQSVELIGRNLRFGS